MPRRSDRERVDDWLRRGLDVGAAASERIAAAALRPRRRRPLPTRLLAVAAVLVAALVAGLWWRGSGDAAATPAAEPILIANFGELIAVVDARGGARLRGTPPLVADGSPRMIVKLGGTDAN